MSGLSRRTVLLGLGISLTAMLAGCAPRFGRAPTLGPTRAPDAGSAPPTAGPSFGPNGTHYPDTLPWLGDIAPTEIEVDCDWDAIAEAVRALSAAQVAAGAVVRLRPGELRGRGFGSSRDPVLKNLGVPTWTRNVAICPRDGYGSVVVTGGARIDACSRLSIFGIDAPDSGLVLTECSDMDLGWSRWSAMGITRGGARIDLYEVVLGFRRDAEDTFGIRPTESHRMVDIRRFGCAFGPSVKPDGDRAHCDTTQLEGTGTGEFGPYLSYDCVDFGSSNSAVLLHEAVTRAEYHHSMVLGAQLPWQIYPLRSGDYPGEPNAFSGGCADVRLYDSIVCGAIGRLGYTHVENTVLSYVPQQSQLPSVSGEWVVDTTIGAWTADDIRQRTGTDYAQESLTALWAW